MEAGRQARRGVKQSTHTTPEPTVFSGLPGRLQHITPTTQLTRSMSRGPTQRRLPPPPSSIRPRHIARVYSASQKTVPSAASRRAGVSPVSRLNENVLSCEGSGGWRGVAGGRGWW
jgi:hypothetical protein